MNKAQAVIDRYMNARLKMELDNVPIPHQIMRDYLDVMILARRQEVGEFYNGTLTLTDQHFNWPQSKVTDLLKTAVEYGWDIRVEGAKW